MKSGIKHYELRMRNQEYKLVREMGKALKVMLGRIGV